MDELNNELINYVVVIWIFIMIASENIKHLWFPKKKGRSVSEFEKLRNKQYFRHNLKNSLKWWISYADNKKIRQGQFGASILFVLEILIGIFGVYRIFRILLCPGEYESLPINSMINNLSYSNSLVKIAGVLFIWNQIMIARGVSAEYSKKGRKEIIQNLQNWQPYKPNGMSRRLADRFPDRWGTFENLNSHIYRNCGSWGYHFFEKNSWSDEEVIYTYFCEYEEKYSLDILQVIHVPILKLEHLKDLDSYLKSLLENYFEGENISQTVTLSYILCVEKENNLYKRMIDTQIQQVEERSVLRMGFSKTNKNLCFTTAYGNQDFEARMLRVKMLDILYQNQN